MGASSIISFPFVQIKVLSYTLIGLNFVRPISCRELRVFSELVKAALSEESSAESDNGKFTSKSAYQPLYFWQVCEYILGIEQCGFHSQLLK